MRDFCPGLCWCISWGPGRPMLALWQDEDPEPVAVFPYAVASLPPEDQEALFRGIVIKNEEDLRYRLEDFLS